ncbi:unnamed protein product [Blepharisma stoltei]|uniref:Uncharacterized protein n=1 Tax=Blepharisma stoltei TaxID=1481888 RepID=A0AAU9K145_9CILI|nr:unnamed protein product [Blepharisma stoltei]
MSSSTLIPFIFWNKNAQDIIHRITCLAAREGFICTGSDTGEICFWLSSLKTYEPDIICTIGKDTECKALTFIKPPSPDLISSDMWVISLHADNKIRSWDINDGRCISSSSSKMIPKQTKIDKIVGIQKRIIAATGEIKEILLIDVWSMEQIGNFTMGSQVAWIHSWNWNLIAMDNKGEVSWWNVPDLSKYYFNKSKLVEISNDPLWSFNVSSDKQAVSFTLAKDASLMAIIYESSLTFIHSSSFRSKQQDKSYLELDRIIVKAEFVQDFLYIVLNDGKILRYEIGMILDEIGFDEMIDGYDPNVKKSFIGMKSSVVKYKTGTNLNSLDSIIAAIDTPLQNFIFYNNKILAWKNEAVIAINLQEMETQTILESKSINFSLQNNDLSCYADCRLLHLFKENEIITVSTVILSDSWPYYIIGTSLGNVFVCPFLPQQSAISYSYHSTAIICILLSKDKLVTCSEDNIMCFWNFNAGSFLRYSISSEEYNRPQSISGNFKAFTGFTTDEIEENRKSKRLSVEIQKREPLHVINVCASLIKIVLQVQPIREAEITPEYFDEIWAKWDQTLLAQCEDGSILLISLNTNEVAFNFPAVSARVKEAYIHMTQDYLIAICEDAKGYIFNMSLQALERIVDETISKNYIRQIVRARASTDTLEDMDESMIDKHKVLQFNIRQQFVVEARAPLSVKAVSIAGRDFPTIMLNVNSIAKKVSKLKQPPAQLEYVLSLLTCWFEKCKAHAAIKYGLQELIHMEDPVVKNSIGTIGVDGCLSFAVPGLRDRYEISSYISSVLMSGILSIINSLKGLKTNLRKNVKQLANSHREVNASHIQNFKNPDPAVLALQFLSGNLIAGDLLESLMPALSKEKIDGIVNFSQIMIDFSESNSTTANNHHYVSLIESLCSILLGFLAIERHQIDSEVVENLVLSLRNMIKSKIQNYVAIAAKILGEGIAIWKINLTKNQIIDLCRELLIHSEKDTELKGTFYKALFKIVACDVNFFLEFLSKEIDNFTFMKTFPETCLTILNMFITKKYEEAAVFLPGIIEVIMRTLDPHSPIIRKNCLEKAGEALKNLVKKLPMVGFSQLTQRLAIGTLDKLIVVYDLKTANQWKVLEGHEGPVSAVEFDKTGKLLASYSSKDGSVRIWKMEKGFFQELMSGSNSKPWLVHNIEKVQSKGSSYKEYLDILNLEWAEDNKSITITREDCNTVVYKIK